MKTIRLNNNELPNVKELIKMLTEEYNKIIQSAEKLDEIYWDIEKEDLNDNNLSDVTFTVGSLYCELKKLFDLEEELFYKDSEPALAVNSTADLFRKENKEILSMCEESKEVILMNNRNSDKKMLQASIIALADFIKRNSIRKKKAMINEIKGMLSDEKITFLKQKIAGKLEFLTS